MAARGGCSDLPLRRRTMDCMWRVEYGTHGLQAVFSGSTQSTARFSLPTTSPVREERVVHGIPGCVDVPWYTFVTGVSRVDPSPTTLRWPVLLTLHASRRKRKRRRRVAQSAWSWTVGSCPQNLEDSLQELLLTAEDDRVAVTICKEESGQLVWNAPRDSRCGHLRW